MPNLESNENAGLQTTKRTASVECYYILSGDVQYSLVGCVPLSQKAIEPIAFLFTDVKKKTRTLTTRFLINTKPL